MLIKFIKHILESGTSFLLSCIFAGVMLSFGIAVFCMTIAAILGTIPRVILGIEILILLGYFVVRWYRNFKKENS